MNSLSSISLVLTAGVLPFSAQGPSLVMANSESAVTSVAYGFITAVLRSECTDAPTSPPPVGGIVVGPDYVIMTVGAWRSVGLRGSSTVGHGRCL